MRMYLTAKGDAPIPDSAMLSDHGVKNDAVLFVVFVKPGKGSDDMDETDDSCWEEVDIQEEGGSLMRD